MQIGAHWSTLVHLAVLWSCAVVIYNTQYSGVTLVVHLIYWWHTGGTFGPLVPGWCMVVAKKMEVAGTVAHNSLNGKSRKLHHSLAPITGVGKYGLNRFIKI